MACMRALPYDTILSEVHTSGLSAIFSAFGPTVDNITMFTNCSEQPAALVPMLLGSKEYEPGLWKTQLALKNLTYADYLWDAMNLAGFTCLAGTRANLSAAAGNPSWRYRFHGVFPNTNISHGAELRLIFGTEFTMPPSTAEEVEVANYVQGAWVAFAKDPADGLRSYQGGWPTYDPAEETLVRLAYDNFVGTNLAFPEPL